MAPTKQDVRYGGPWFAQARPLLSGGETRQGRAARFFAEAVRRPQRVAALLALLTRMSSERIDLSDSAAGHSLREYFDQRVFGVFPRNRLCRAVLALPERHEEYLRGRSRQALRTNLRRAAEAGIRCELVADPHSALDLMLQVLGGRQGSVPDEDAEFWRARLARPNLTLMVAREATGRPLALTGAVIDDSACLIAFSLANDHLARWALHDHLVRDLIARRVEYLLAEGGGVFGALGFAPNLQSYQQLLGYELRHVGPAPARAGLRGSRHDVLEQRPSRVVRPHQRLDV